MHDKKIQIKSGKPEGKPRILARVPAPEIKTIAKEPKKKPNVKTKSDESHSELQTPAKIPRNTEMSAIPCDFGSLRLGTLEEYEIPCEIFRIESNKDSSYISQIENMVRNSTTDRLQYTQAYTALLHLEEAAEIVFFRKYNQIIQLTYCSGRTFQIRNDVCN